MQTGCIMRNIGNNYRSATKATPRFLGEGNGRLLRMA